MSASMHGWCHLVNAYRVKAKPQPTKDLVHIQGQNNSSRSNIFVGFAEEKIAGLRQNIHFQQQKVGGQRIVFAHKD